MAQHFNDPDDDWIFSRLSDGIDHSASSIQPIPKKTWFVTVLGDRVP
jgi:hypothetical protein